MAALFPALVMKLLDFVAIYGLLLVPMGAVILADFYLIPKLGLQPFYAEKKQIDFNVAAGATWFIMLALALALRIFLKIDVFFLPAPIWILSVGAYLLFSKFYQHD